MILAIGTAQFGSPYGINNRGHVVDKCEIRKILSCSRANGISFLDTAISYGNSEDILGQVGVGEWKVITKLPKIPLDTDNIADWIELEICNSLKRLNLKEVYAVLLHRPSQILEERGQEIIYGLKRLKTKKLARKIGVSIYDPSELENYNVNLNFDIVQSPLSIIDQRLISSGWYANLLNLKIEIHVRSIFLQGLLLIPRGSRPLKFQKFSTIWDIWDKWLSKNNFTELEGCLSFINSLSGLDAVVIGIDSLEQLNQILSLPYNSTPDMPKWPKVIDQKLINPSLWDTI